MPHPGALGGRPHIARLRFRVVPDGVVRAMRATEMSEAELEAALAPLLG